jgi:hypothetical protein
MILVNRNKNICSQINVPIFYLFLEVLEILLEFEIYFLDPILILIFSPLDFNFSYFGPLIIEFLFQEFIRLHVELYNLFRRKL